MRLRWLMSLSLLFLTCATSAFANKRADLPTSGGGVLNDCGSPRDATGLFFSSSPVVSLTPMSIKDSSGNTYTAHVDVYDWGNLACLYPEDGYSSTDTNEIRSSGAHSIFVVYVEGPNGTTVAQSALHSFEIARPLTHPDFNICESGWTYCNTSTPGPDLESQNTPLLEPAASPGADGSSTVWSFGPGYDVSTATPIPLNSNVDTMNHFGGVPYGYATLVADGTVTCDNPAVGPCNSLSASTPYSLTFTPPGESTPLTVSSIAAKTFTSAAGHDSSANPIVITGGAFQGLYNVAGNYPTLTNGVPTNSDGSNASNVTFNCATLSTSLTQQFRSVYFKWVAPASTNVTVSTAGSHYDTILMVAALTGASFQTCNDDNDPTSTNYPKGIGLVTSALTFTATAGTTYQFLVTEYPQTQMSIEAVDDSFNQTDDTYIGPLSGDSSLYFTLSAAPVNVTTTGGTKGYVPVFTGGATMVNSIIQQYNGGIGIGRPPAATLDVNGKSIFRGGMIMSRVGDATTSAGATSSPLEMQSSVYNTSAKINLLPYFQLETEPTGNNTASTGATLNFLYYSGVGCCAAETGLYINPNGTIHFAAGQTFPGTKPAVKTTLSTVLQGEPGPPGPAGPTGPAGVVGPDVAVPGTVVASRGFFSESNDASAPAFIASNSADNAAVMSLSSTGSGSHGLLARSAWVGLYAQGASYAARFNGALATDSNLSSSASSYKIDDPLNPDAATLSHATVSSAQRMNLYDGIAVTDSNGIAVVTMPKYFELLNRDFQYQLTVLGQFSRAIVATRIANGAFTIRTEKPNVKVSWQVTGIRQDAWANAHPIAVEAAKPNSGDGPIIRTGPMLPATGSATVEPAHLQPAPR